MAPPACRFVLIDIDKSEVRGWDAFDVFEPKVILEVHGENSFERLGVPNSGPVVLVDFLDEALEETLLITRRIEAGVTQGRHEFELTASLWVVVLEMLDRGLVLTLDGTSVTGIERAQVIGRITVPDWVDALVRLAREVLDLFRRENFGSYEHLSGWEETAQKLEAWVAADH